MLIKFFGIFNLGFLDVNLENNNGVLEWLLIKEFRFKSFEF